MAFLIASSMSCSAFMSKTSLLMFIQVMVLPLGRFPTPNNCSSVSDAAVGLSVLLAVEPCVLFSARIYSLNMLDGIGRRHFGSSGDYTRMRKTLKVAAVSQRFRRLCECVVCSNNSSLKASERLFF